MKQSRARIDKIISCGEKLSQYFSDFVLKVKTKLIQELPLLKWIFGSVFAWGVLAHGYMFTSHALTHDSLSEFSGDIHVKIWKYGLGRFAVQIYRTIFRGELTAPWVIGFLTLLWISLALLMLCKSFKITSRWAIIVLSGCLITNIFFTATAASYVHDLDQNMMAMMLSVAAFYLWKCCRWGWLIAIPAAVFSLGLYQAYISVTVMLIMFDMLLDLYDGCRWKDFFKKCFTAAILFACSGALYIAALKITPMITGIPLLTGHYNTSDVKIDSYQIMWEILKEVYLKFDDFVFYIPTAYPVMFIGALKKILVICALAVLLANFNKKCTFLHRIMMIALCALAPIGLMPSHILSGVSHEVMRYSICTLYIAAVILFFNIQKHQVPVRFAVIACLGICFWSDIVAANNIYTRKRIEYDAARDFCHRVLARIETTPGYKSGETEVVFIGSEPEFYNVPACSKYFYLAGLWHDRQMTHSVEWYRGMFKYAMRSNVKLVFYEDFEKFNNDDKFVDMPVFPAPGSIVMHDDVVVVKIGETRPRPNLGRCK